MKYLIWLTITIIICLLIDRTYSKRISDIELEKSSLEMSLSKQESIIESNYSEIYDLRNKVDSLDTVTTSYEIIMNIVGTMYHPTVEQCDSDPDITADGSKIDIPNASKHKWIAVSYNLHKRYGGQYDFGDEVILISKNGILGKYIVRDLMNECWIDKIDILETPGTSIYSYPELTVIKI